MMRARVSENCRCTVVYGYSVREGTDELGRLDSALGPHLPLLAYFGLCNSTCSLRMIGRQQVLGLAQKGVLCQNKHGMIGRYLRTCSTHDQA
jgi:hypothetical protein